MSTRPRPDRTVDVSPTERISDFVEHDVDQSEGAVGDEVRKTLAALMPWGVSIVAHVVLVVFAFFLVWQTIVTGPEEKPTVPTLVPTPDVVKFTKSDIDAIEPDSGSPPLTPVLNIVTPSEPIVPGFDKPVVSIPNPGQGTEGFDQGFDKGDGPGDGLIDEGDIIGSSKVVFIIDASGSMVDVLPFVENEMKRLLQTLDSKLKATIIVFSGKGVFEVPGGGGVRGLRPLTAQFKEQIRDWTTLSNHRFETGGPGGANVLTAIDRGMSYKPELVFLLSDNLTGGGQGATKHELFQSEILQVVQKHKKATPSVRINTIQFLYEDPLVRAGLTGSLRLIADETGGTYKFMGQDDLKLR